MSRAYKYARELLFISFTFSFIAFASVRLSAGKFAIATSTILDVISATDLNCLPKYVPSAVIPLPLKNSFASYDSVAWIYSTASDKYSSLSFSVGFFLAKYFEALLVKCVVSINLVHSLENHQSFPS